MHKGGPQPGKKKGEKGVKRRRIIRREREEREKNNPGERKG